MQQLIKVASYPTMKHEALSFLGPALKNSGFIKRTWPHHYLDHLGVRGNELVTHSGRWKSGFEGD